MRRPSSTLVPARRTTRGTATRTSWTAWTTPAATQSQRLMPANTFTRIALTLRSESTNRNAAATRSGLAPPPMSRKLAGSPPECYHVHGRHGQARPVDDAPDVAVQGDVVQPVLRRVGLPRVLLRVVPQLGHIGPAEHRIVVETHLYVEGEDMAVLDDDERIELHHRGVQVAERPVGAQDGRHRLVHLLGSEAETERELTSLERAHAHRRLDHLPQDRGRLPLRDLLDLHATVRMGHHDDPLMLAVQHEADVQLALDGERLLHEHAMHRQSLGAGLTGHQDLAEQILGGVPHVGIGGAQPHAPCFAASARVDLGLHDPAAATDFRRAIHRLLRAVRDAALGHRHAEAREQLFRLVLVDVHGQARVAAREGATALRAAIAAAISTMFRAMRADAASIIRPSSWAAPRPARAASSRALKIRRARSTSGGGGVNTSFASASCDG